MTAGFRSGAGLALQHRHALAGWMKQISLAYEVGYEPSWAYDLSTAKLELAGEQFDAGVLGSYSEQSLSWMWADGNSTIGPLVSYPATRLRDALRADGVVLPELAEATLAGATEEDAWLIAVTSASVLGVGATFRCPYAGGAAFVLIDKIPAHRPERHRLTAALVDFVRMVNAPLRPYVEGWVHAWQLEHGASHHSIHLRVWDLDVQLEFDELGRVVHLLIP